MKVTVRIHKSTGLEFKTKKIEDDGRITLIKDSRKKAQWRPEIGGIETKHGWFGRAKFYTEVMPNANKTFIINGELKPEEIPKWDKNTSKAFINKKILEKAGEEMKDKNPSMALLLLGILIIANIAITILMVSGRLRF